MVLYLFSGQTALSSPSTANTTLDTQPEESPSGSNVNLDGSGLANSNTATNSSNNGAVVATNHTNDKESRDKFESANHEQENVSQNQRTCIDPVHLTNGNTNSDLDGNHSKAPRLNIEHCVSEPIHEQDALLIEQKQYKKDKSKYHKKKSRKVDKSMESIGSIRNDTISHG